MRESFRLFIQLGIVFLFSASLALAQSGRIAIEAVGRNLQDSIPFTKQLLENEGYVVDIVSGADIDTAEEINQYDAVLIGDSGFFDNDWGMFSAALRD